MACFTYEAQEWVLATANYYISQHIFSVPQHMYRASRQDVGLAQFTSHKTEWRIPFSPTLNTDIIYAD